MKEEIMEKFEDEMEDVCEYLDLAEISPPTLAAGLRAIAHDEYTHARFFHDYLESVNSLKPEYKEKWKKTEARMQK
jgi:rubrerythrin